MTLPRLPRQPLVPPELEDPEVWQPTWRCFCCHDSGWVRHPNLVIPDFDNNQDRNIVCQAPKCQASARLLSSPLILENPDSFDFRFDPRICQEIDKLVREDFQRTAQSRQVAIQARKLLKQQALLAQKMNLRTRDRTPEELEYIARNLAATNLKLALPSLDPSKKEEVLDEDFVASVC